MNQLTTLNYKQSIVDTKHFLENENVAVTAFGEGDKNERL